MYNNKSYFEIDQGFNGTKFSKVMTKLYRQYKEYITERL